jgi:uncharacterized protein YceH (UPF0502 family)
MRVEGGLRNTAADLEEHIIMSDTDSAPEAQPSWVPLTAPERRVVGVLAEKSKTTPEYYPLTLAALVAGCNQKNNRDPLTNYDQDDVAETLESLRKKGAVILVQGSGRVPRWKHTLYDWLKVTKAEMAVMVELLLRGPQTEGELRARASRMETLPDLPALQAILEALAPRRLVEYLSPPGQKRGVFVTHGLYPPSEFEKVRQTYAGRQAENDEPPARLTTPRAEFAATASAPGPAELAALRGEVDQLRALLEALTEEVRQLKSALGA